MRSLWLALIAVLAFGLYVAFLNKAFLRCPACRRIGSWRFEPIGDPLEEFDEDQNLVRQEQIKRCRSCGDEALHRWSDLDGQTIRPMRKQR